MHSAAQKYLNTQMNTTSQGELLVKLYDGAIRYLNLAKEKMEERDYEAKGLLLTKAMTVIDELLSSLNKDKGGELAQNLGNLYLYCNSRLMTANMRLDTSIVDEVIKILSNLRDAFAQIIENGAEAEAPATPQAPVRMRSSSKSHAGLNLETAAEDEAGGTQASQPTPGALRKRIQAYGQANS